jgi:long-subunit fatty acid transport protein
MRSVFAFLITTALFLLAVVRISAQEERAIDHFSGVGVRAMGMGGAYLGVADDFTAVHWNPAGLAQMTQREVYVGARRNAYDSETTQTGITARSEVKNTRFSSFGFVFPYPVYRGSLVLAVGFNKVKDFDSIVRLGGFSAVDSLQQDSRFSHEGELEAKTLAVAVDVAPSVSLGIALNLINGDNENVQENVFNDVENLYEERRWTARDVFTDEYETSFSAKLGLLVRTPRNDPQVRLGFTLATGPTHEIDYRFKGIPSENGYNLIEYDDGSVCRDVVIEDGSCTSVQVLDRRSSYKVSLPLEFGAGGSARPIPELLVAASVHFSEWSQSEYKGEDDNDLRANASFENQYRDVIRYHLGVEYQVPQIALDLRAGFYTDPLPFVGPRNPDLAMDPVSNPPIIVTQERRFVTLGVGLLLEEAVRADVALIRGTAEVKEGPLEERTTLNRAFFGFTYSF